MERLGAHLRFFIRRKISEDPAWRGPTIVFSGAPITHHNLAALPLTGLASPELSRL